MDSDIKSGNGQNPAPAVGGENPFGNPPASTNQSATINSSKQATASTSVEPPATPVSPEQSTTQFSQNTPPAAQPTFGGALFPSSSSQPTNSNPAGFGPVNTGTSNTPTTANKKSSPLKWILIIGIPLIIIAGLLIWYFCFVCNKYNIVRNALYSVMSNRENSLNYDVSMYDDEHSIAVKGAVSYLANSNASGDISINIKDGNNSMDIGQIAFVSDGSNLYLKLNASDDINTMLSASGVDLDTLGVNDQWLTINSETLSSITTVSATDSNGNAADPDDVLQCFDITQDELDNRASQQQIVDALLDTGFLVIDDTNSDQDGKIYQISLDGSRYGDFVHQLVNSNVIQTLSSCLNDNGIEADFTDLDDDELAEIGEEIDDTGLELKLWIEGTFSPQLNKVGISYTAQGDNEPNIDITINLANQTPTIDIPSDSKTIQEFIQDNPQLLLQSSTLLNNNLTQAGTTVNVTSTSDPEMYQYLEMMNRSEQGQLLDNLSN